MSFDPVLDRSLVTSQGSGSVVSAEPVVITRRYQAAHNVGWFRFVEYAGLDELSEPRGDLAPMGEILFPFDAGLQRLYGEVAGASTPDGGLRAIPVVRQDGPLVEERYAVDRAGIISVTITDLTTGYTQQHVLQA